MSDILKHDSTKTFRPIIYQFLIALEKCFEMQGGESIWIEKFGDVTNSSGEQIEVKDYQSDLTDLDYNVWKTLKNWLDDGFDTSYYHSLILLTTQDLSKSTKFIDWNKKDKNEKLSILKEIAIEYSKKKKKSETTENLLNEVLDHSKATKLVQILDKFIIDSSYIRDEELYKKLIETRTDGVIENKKEDYINALLGYIVSPITTSNNWEIKNKDFRQKTTSLIETYTSTTKIFPKIELNISDQEAEEHQNYLFIKKLEDINYTDVTSEAISDFIYTRTVIANELSNYQISTKEYNEYEEEIYKSYQSKYRVASRNTDETKKIKDSKNLYDSITGENAPDFYNFNDTPKKYRNGLLHEIADAEESPDKLVWKLKVEDE